MFTYSDFTRTMRRTRVLAEVSSSYKGITAFIYIHNHITTYFDHKASLIYTALFLVLSTWPHI